MAAGGQGKSPARALARYEVPHPGFVMVGKAVVVVLGENDAVSMIDALHIAAIEDFPAEPRGP